ncbi:MAG: hypothetical protein GEV28_05130 [Actinophytocola sp.]|uniref:hypothetical protein n=1 Tax=Actinophytocola sp. TaxID=1872138 RepID=UPI001324F771|nr:hypothetical protein [Actinophytocola sp.]MPZ79801.1 hypothetical protein [Actinophytocola sp.]
MDGASPAPAAGSRLRRLLRRGLLIATVTAAGWLLSATFANSASADEPLPDTPPAQEEVPVSDEPADTPTDLPADEPVDAPANTPADEPADEPVEPPVDEVPAPPATEPVTEPVTEPITEPIGEPDQTPVTDPATEPAAEPVQQQSQAPQPSGLIGGLTNTLGGITHAVADVAAAVLDNTGHALAPIVTPPANGSMLPLPYLLPDLGLPGLGGPLDPDGTSRAEVVPVPAAPPALPATPALPPTIVIAPEHTPRAAVAVGTPQSTSSQPGSAAEHADESGPGRPVKAPAAPVAPGGTAVSTAHDNAGGARGPHGMLAAQTSLQLSASGFTTRSRAADVTGRVVGLPAISPD